MLQICMFAFLLGKTRVKCMREEVPLCENTVFSRTIYKRAHFYRVFPCKMRVSRNCKNTRVLPCKSRHWAQKWPSNGPQNGPRIAQKPGFTEVLRHRHYKNTVFYQVKWTSDRLKWPCWKRWSRTCILLGFYRVKWRPPMRLYRVFSRKVRFGNPLWPLRGAIISVITE